MSLYVNGIYVDCIELDLAIFQSENLYLLIGVFRLALSNKNRNGKINFKNIVCLIHCIQNIILIYNQYENEINLFLVLNIN